MSVFSTHRRFGLGHFQQGRPPPCPDRPAKVFGMPWPVAFGLCAAAAWAVVLCPSYLFTAAG